jgi:hypothetical protein
MVPLTFFHAASPSVVGETDTALLTTLRTSEVIGAEARGPINPWQKPPSKRARKTLLPHGTLRDKLRPERAERRARLVKAIARGRRWLQEIVTGSVTDAE